MPKTIGGDYRWTAEFGASGASAGASAGASELFAGALGYMAMADQIWTHLSVRAHASISPLPSLSPLLSMAETEEPGTPLDTHLEESEECQTPTREGRSRSASISPFPTLSPLSPRPEEPGTPLDTHLEESEECQTPTREGRSRSASISPFPTLSPLSPRPEEPGTPLDTPLNQILAHLADTPPNVMPQQEVAQSPPWRDETWQVMRVGSHVLAPLIAGLAQCQTPTRRSRYASISPSPSLSTPPSPRAEEPGTPLDTPLDQILAPLADTPPMPQQEVAHSPSQRNETWQVMRAGSHVLAPLIAGYGGGSVETPSIDTSGASSAAPAHKRQRLKFGTLGPDTSFDCTVFTSKPEVCFLPRPAASCK
jgi:hypothetical protein